MSARAGGPGGGGPVDEAPRIPRVFGPDTVGRAARRDPAVTVGFFDGLHRGHQGLLAALRAWADEVAGEAWVITFRRHPAAVLRGEGPPAIMNLRHRLRAILRHGVDGILLLSFDRELAALEPEAFVRRYVIELLGGRRVILGFNSAIGRDRKGTAAYLESVAGELGVEVRTGAPVTLEDGTLASSTAVRRAIVEGRLERAEAMLGRPVSLLGRVVSGEGRGRALGFPTANLDLEHEAVPPVGVYMARTALDGAAYPALLSIGSRPTFSGIACAGEPFRESRDVVEVHLVGFTGDLYGRDLEVEVLRRLRDERTFSDPEALVGRMKEDLRELLQALRTSSVLRLGGRRET